MSGLQFRKDFKLTDMGDFLPKFLRKHQELRLGHVNFKWIEIRPGGELRQGEKQAWRKGGRCGMEK